MDHDVEMLRLYFIENGYSDSAIKKCLEDNPFTKDFVEWEKKHYMSNKFFAKYLIRNGFVHSDDSFYEVAFDEKNCITRYLNNKKNIIRSSTMDEPKIYIPENHTTILMQPFQNMDVTIKKLYRKDIDFITGVCTKNNRFYYRALNELLDLRNELANTELCTNRKYEYSICTLRKVKTKTR